MRDFLRGQAGITGAVRRVRMLAERTGLLRLRDTVLDLETVSRLSLRAPGRDAPPAGLRVRSIPEFVGNPHEWVQADDRVTFPGDATFGWDAIRRRAGARTALTDATSPAFSDGPTEIGWSDTENLSAGPHLTDQPRYVTCDARNLVINFSHLYPTRTTRYRPWHKRGPGRQYHRYRDGALAGACRWAGDFQPDAMPRDLLRDIFGSFRTWTGEPAAAYDEIVEHPVLFVTREGDESRNFFHAMADFLNAFEAIMMANADSAIVPRQELEVVLLDNAPPAWTDPIWTQVFAPERGVRRVGDFAGRRVLFKHAIFSAPCYHSFLFAYLASENERPERVGMLDAFAALVLRSFGLSPTAARTPGPLRITFVSRQLYALSVSATSASVRTSDRWIARQIANEEACIAALRAIGNAEVRVVDFAHYSLDGQFRIARDTDVLIGAHGAGLTHLLWTPPHGGLLEIAVRPGPDWKAWRVFPNMASWTGRPHAVIDAPERAITTGTELTVDVELFAHTAHDLVTEVRRRGAIT